MSEPCPFTCTNKTEFGYCKTTVCLYAPTIRVTSMPRTNYDRIISKTPEELAEWIASVAQGGDGSCAPGCHACNGKTYCTEPWLEWLKQEAHD